MNLPAIQKRIELLEAQADSMKDCCNRLKQELGLEENRKNKYAASSAKVLANYRKSINKKASAARTANANPSK